MRSILRAVVCGAVIAAWSTVSGAEPAAPAERPGDKAQARLLTALQTTAEALRSRSLEPAELPRFHELLAAAEAYWQDEAVPVDRRAKWCGLAKARLHEGAVVLRRQEAAAAQASKIGAAKRPASVQPRQTALAQVGGVGQFGAVGAIQNVASPAQAAADEAQKLIDLIQSVVRPDTWDVNGGQGIIKYWSLGHALVIYNTSDVHERIGGSVGFLRK
jgi:hypothetical protein